VHPVYAALTPITATHSPFRELTGVSLRVKLTARDGAAKRAATATGGFLFTHQGYSGPSVLDVSHVVARSRVDSLGSARLTVQWTELGASEWEDALRPQGNRTVTGALRALLPDRLAAVLLTLANIESTRSLAELRRQERIRLIEILVSGELPWSGDEGYRKAEVTGGGVSLAEVHSQTMESKRHPGLHICGEVLDAFGPVGGYNFFWAWATGRAAGLGASAERVRV
jgi:predicted Rossmann fold flavoprotein